MQVQNSEWYGIVGLSFLYQNLPVKERTLLEIILGVDVLDR